MYSLCPKPNKDDAQIDILAELDRNYHYQDLGQISSTSFAVIEHRNSSPKRWSLIQVNPTLTQALKMH